MFFILIFSINPTQSLVVASSCPLEDPCKAISNPNEKVNCYSGVVNTCSSQRESMAAQIVYLTTKIELTTAKIETTRQKISLLEKEIGDLSDKIGKLENSLTTITGVFIDRVIATYKYGEVSFLSLVLNSRQLSDFLNRYKYLQTVQAHDRRMLFQLQNSKINFEDQKKLREEKKQELNSAKKQLEKEESTLDQQKREKEVFLQVTKNSEAIYKQNLSAAQKEAQNIQQAASILSQAGVSRRVGKGETIGIMGNTGFSTGPHLHFSVYNLQESDLNKFNFEAGYENPFNNLSSRNLTFHTNSCDDVAGRQQKNIGSGSWDWPMSNPSITQCFGHTPVSNAYYKSGMHNGVDMFDDANPLVKAVDEGNAYTYRGGQSAGNGVFIFHPNGKMTLYWHLQ